MAIEKPIEIVDSPESPFAELFPEIVERNLDAEIDRQADDGGWHPKWSWSDGACAESWPVAERDSAGFLTLRALLILRSFGRLAEV